jgi:cellulose synthase operon protein C
MDRRASPSIPVASPTPNDVLREASKLRRAGRPAEALALLLPLLERDPRSRRRLYETALCRLDLRDRTGAEALVERLLEVSPGDRAGLLLRLNIAKAFDDLPTTLACAARIVALAPDDVVLRIEQAKMLRHAGRFAEARDVLLDFSSAHAAPPDPAFLLALAACHHSLGEHASAFALVEDVLAVQPSRIDALILGQRCAVALGEVEPLRRHARRLAASLALPGMPAAALRSLAITLARLVYRIPAGPKDEDWLSWLALLCDVAADLPADLLWDLFRSAAPLGLQRHCRVLLEAMFARRDVGLATASAMLTAAHSTGGKELDLLAPRLRDSLDADAIPAFDLTYTALRDGAEAALARRRRVTSRNAAMVLLLYRLLLVVGRRSLALRYLGFACRAYPGDGNLRLHWLQGAVAAGEIDRAQRDVQRLLAAPGALGEKARPIAARALLEFGEAEAALRLMDGLPAEKGPGGIRFQALLRLGRGAEAEGVLADVPAGVPARKQPHLNASLIGQRLTEFRLEATAGASPSAAQFVGAAIREIDAWLVRPKARTAAVREVTPGILMQYWDSGHPPAALRTIMASWQGVEGLEYRLFDRVAARHFLLAHLGAEWEDALRLARHPAEESDFFRLCFLLVRGGVYADCDDRLLCPIEPFLKDQPGLTIFQEPQGALCNNFLLATPRHPILAQAAIAARQALLRRDNDSPWSKTGPGLLTRMVAGALREAARQGTDPRVRILPLHLAGRHVQFHTPLPYKRTRAYWNPVPGLGMMDGLASLLAAPATVRRVATGHAAGAA